MNGYKKCIPKNLYINEHKCGDSKIEKSDEFFNLIKITKDSLLNMDCISEELLKNLYDLFYFWSDEASDYLNEFPIVDIFFNGFLKKMVNVVTLLEFVEYVSESKKLLNQVIDNSDLLNFIVNLLPKNIIEYNLIIISIFINISSVGAIETSKLGEAAVTFTVDLIQKNSPSDSNELYNLIIEFFGNLLDKIDYFPINNFERIIVILIESILNDNINEDSFYALESASKFHDNEFLSLFKSSEYLDIFIRLFNSNDESIIEFALNILISLTYETSEKIRMEIVKKVNYSELVCNILNNYPNCFLSLLLLTNNIIQLEYSYDDLEPDEASILLETCFYDVLKILMYFKDNFQELSFKEKKYTSNLFCSVVYLSNFKMKIEIIQNEELICSLCELLMLNPKIDTNILTAFNSFFKISSIKSKLVNLSKIITNMVDINELHEYYIKEDDFTLLNICEKLEDKLNFYLKSGIE